MLRTLRAPLVWSYNDAALIYPSQLLCFAFSSSLQDPTEHLAEYYTI